MNSYLIFMTNGNLYTETLIHTVGLRTHCPCPPTNDYKKLRRQVFGLYLEAQSMLLKS